MSNSNEFQTFIDTLKELINLLPASYNKETSDVNYYRLLRSVALELRDAQIEVQQLKNDLYLNTVRPSRIYETFGTLVKLEQDATWSSDKYRSLVQGVMKSLLAGPTTQSMADGIKLFIQSMVDDMTLPQGMTPDQTQLFIDTIKQQFKVNIYELYKDLDKVDPNIAKGVNPRFAFVIEVNKPIDANVDQSEMLKDVNYIVNIIKPAHTISIIVTVLYGEENYKNWYSDATNRPDIAQIRQNQLQTMQEEDQQKQAMGYQPDPLLKILNGVGIPAYFGMDQSSSESNLEPADNIYGYQYLGTGVFMTGSSLIGGTDLIGPIYAMADVTETMIASDYESEEYADPQPHMAALDTKGPGFYDGYDVLNDIKLNEGTELRGSGLEDTAPSPDDGNHFVVEAETTYEELVSLVGSSTSMFQLGSSELTGTDSLSPVNNDLVTNIGMAEKEFVDFTSKDDSQYSLRATQPPYTDQYDTQTSVHEGLAYTTYSEDASNIVTMQEINTLTLNTATLNSSRFNGLERDQYFMEMITITTAEQTDEQELLPWYAL